jgi:hypothetical protein
MGVCGAGVLEPAAVSAEPPAVGGMEGAAARGRRNASGSMRLKANRVSGAVLSQRRSGPAVLRFSTPLLRATAHGAPAAAFPGGFVACSGSSTSPLQSAHSEVESLAFWTSAACKKGSTKRRSCCRELPLLALPRAVAGEGPPQTLSELCCTGLRQETGSQGSGMAAAPVLQWARDMALTLLTQQTLSLRSVAPATVGDGGPLAPAR